MLESGWHVSLLGIFGLKRNMYLKKLKQYKLTCPLKKLSDTILYFIELRDVIFKHLVSKNYFS